MFIAVDKLNNIKLIIQYGGENVGYYVYVYNLAEDKCFADYLQDNMEQAFNFAKHEYNIDEDEFKEDEDVIFPARIYIYETIGKLNNVDVLLRLELNSGKHHLTIYNLVNNELIADHTCKTLNEVFNITSNLYNVVQDDFVMVAEDE